MKAIGTFTDDLASISLAFLNSTQWVIEFLFQWQIKRSYLMLVKMYPNVLLIQPQIQHAMKKN